MGYLSWFQNITGATNQSYTATSNGSYALLITDRGCTSSSICISVTSTSVDELNKDGMVIYPNPSNSNFGLLFLKFKTINIYNVTGQLVMTLNGQFNYQIDVSEWIMASISFKLKMEQLKNL